MSEINSIESINLVSSPIIQTETNIKQFYNLEEEKMEDIFFLGSDVLLKKVSTLEDTLIKNRDLYIKQFDIYENEKTEYEKLIEKLKNTLTHKDNEINEHSTKNKETEEKLGIEKEEKTNLINEINSYKSKCEELNKIIENQKQEITELKEKKSFINSEINSKYEEAIKNFEEIKKKNIELEAKNNEYNIEIKNKNLENSNLNNKLNELSSKLEENSQNNINALVEGEVMRTKIEEL
jgi:chromosome segregation ATPase